MRERRSMAFHTGGRLCCIRDARRTDRKPEDVETGAREERERSERGDIASRNGV